MPMTKAEPYLVIGGPLWFCCRQSAAPAGLDHAVPAGNRQVCHRYPGLRMLGLWPALPEWFELVDPAVCHQREEEMTVLDHVRPDVAPLPHNLIVQGPGRTFGARQGQWTELEFISSKE